MSIEFENISVEVKQDEICFVEKRDDGSFYVFVKDNKNVDIHVRNVQEYGTISVYSDGKLVHQVKAGKLVIFGHVAPGLIKIECDGVEMEKCILYFRTVPITARTEPLPFSWSSIRYHAQMLVVGPMSKNHVDLVAEGIKELECPWTTLMTDYADSDEFSNVADFVHETNKAVLEDRLELSASGEHNLSFECFIFNNAFSTDFIKSKPYSEVIMNGRHFGKTSFTVMQYTLDIPARLRCNFDAIFAAREPCQQNRRKLYNHYFGDIFESFDAFEKVFGEATRDYGYLVLVRNSKATCWQECVFALRM